MGESVSCQVVSLEKSHVTHGASIWLHPCTHRAKIFGNHNQLNRTHSLLPFIQTCPKAQHDATVNHSANIS